MPTTAGASSCISSASTSPVPHPSRQYWQRTLTPLDGDGVLLRRAQHPIHVGLWVAITPTEQGVLHCVEHSGVVFQNVASLSAVGWQREGCYRYEGAP